MKSMMRFLLLILCSLIFTGCASVNMAPASQDSRAKNFKPETDKATIYVYRNETFGAAVKMPVLLNGYHVADTIANSYLAMSVSAGNFQVTSKTENDSSVDLKVESGKNYFVWQEVKMGVWSGRSQLQVVSEEKGKAGVLECKLVQQKHLPNQAENAEKPSSASASPAQKVAEAETGTRQAMHPYIIPPPSGFARIEEGTRVPIRGELRQSYTNYMEKSAPKAFVIGDKSGAFTEFGPDSIRQAFERCFRTNWSCWLYAVDDRVLWTTRISNRLALRDLKPLATPDK